MKYIGSIDQGTTSTRFILFSKQGLPIFSHQIEHKQYYPKPGWVEHDGEQIYKNTQKCIQRVIKDNEVDPKDILAFGITNQRETIIAFNPKTDEIYHKAIVWQDLRGDEILQRISKEISEEEMHEISGLRLSPYFSASKISWLLENVEDLREKAENDEVIFATIDCFLAYKLTGSIITDVTNASRYGLMDIDKLTWSDKLLKIFNIPKKSLPEIVPSYGKIFATSFKNGPFKAQIPLAAILGDQQSALFGQACFEEGSAKSTYGTGCFMLSNTGSKRVKSKNGLLSTVAYMQDGKKPIYALEGSVAIAGSLVQWVRDNLEMVESASQLDQLAASVTDNAGVYIVPAFSGLFAPYWRSDARGVIAGLTGFVNKRHICRAALESVAFQAYDIFKAMQEDSKVVLKYLKVDGGLTNSIPLMEFQADILNIQVQKPHVVETTARGVAYGAGLSIGLYKDLDEIKKYWKQKMNFLPALSEEERERKIKLWHKAVERTLEWEDN